MRIRPYLLAAAMAATFVTPMVAAEVDQARDVKGMEWSVAEGHAGAHLVVTGPEGFRHEKTFEAGQALAFNFSELHGQYLPDGKYSYELVITPTVTDSQRQDMQIARELGVSDTPGTGLELPQALPTQSGSFSIEAGGVLDSGKSELMVKDIVHNDDTIITFSLCVGNDCVNGENFGFDTVRLKENNLRIHFLDTSNSGSFPSNDWRITINDSSNGGDNYFSIDDASAGTQPFRVDAGAGNNALRIEAGGHVGIGKANPAVELHVTDGDSPTLRLEQDGSSGFTPQTYDIVSNEANFFVRDVTNGSQLPFRIKPGADTDALFIAANNNIGMGTDNPSQALHVRGTTGSTGLLIEEASATLAERQLLTLRNKGGGQIQFVDSDTNGETWQVGPRSTNHDFEITRQGSGDVELLIDATTNNVHIRGELFTGGGQCGSGCDAVFQEDYALPSIADHAKEMWSLGYLPNIGPTVEGEPFNLSDRTGRMLNELEKAHIYIEQLHKRLEKLERALN